MFVDDGFVDVGWFVGRWRKRRHTSTIHRWNQFDSIIVVGCVQSVRFVNVR